MPFVGKLILEYTDEEWNGRTVWLTRGEFGYLLEAPGFSLAVQVPSGTKTDLASIPRLIHRWYRPDGPWSPAAVIHDVLCEQKPCGWLLAHVILWQCLCELPKVTWWSRLQITFWVVLLGPKWRYRAMPPFPVVPKDAFRDMPTARLDPVPSDPKYDPVEIVP